MGQTFEWAIAEFPELEPTVLSRDPWVVAFEKFLSAEEIETILRHGEGAQPAGRAKLQALRHNSP